MTVHLDQESVDAIAHRVVELIEAPITTEGEMVDAAEITRRFSVSLDYVYENADKLGAGRLSDGPRARLRFDPHLVRERLGPRPDPRATPSPPATARRRRRPQQGPDVDLLPIRGKS